MIQLLAGVAGAAAVYRIALHALYSDSPNRRERHSVTTPDGSRISLYHVPARERRWAEPVLFCHGLGANHANLDFSMPGYSVAEAFAREGFDCWTIDLRGAGKSRPAHANWHFDDYVEQDLPTAIDYILKRSQSSKIHWVGHSMGGMLLYAYLLGPRKNDVVSGVTLGSPARFLEPPAHFEIQRRLASWILPVTRKAPIQTLGQWSVPMTYLLTHWLVEHLANWENIDPYVLRRAQYQATSNFSRNLTKQFLDWIGDGGNVRSKDGAQQWSRRLQEIQHPILVVAGGGDLVISPADVRYAAEAMKSNAEYLELSKQNGFHADYGHIDLVFGRKSPELVFPKLIAHVQRHASKI